MKEFTEALKELRALATRLYMSNESWVTSNFRVLCCDIFQAARDFPDPAMRPEAPTHGVDTSPAALRAPEVSQWRPMDSAPKDGTTVVVFWDGDDAGVTHAATAQPEALTNFQGEVVGWVWVTSDEDRIAEMFLRGWLPLSGGPRT